MTFSIPRIRNSLRRAHTSLGPRSIPLKRLASTSSSPFPFPHGPNPTPWQIFHLPTSASQKDIKARYYELVRRYHPDSAFARSLPPDVAHTQFQAVSRAYDVLRGRKASMAVDDTADGPAIKPHNDVEFEIWKARQARKADIDVAFDERWQDKMLVGILIFAIFSFVAQIVWARRRRKIEAAFKEKGSYRQNVKPAGTSAPSEAVIQSITDSSATKQEEDTELPHSQPSPSSTCSEEWSLGPRI